MPSSGGTPIVLSQDNLNEQAVRLGSPNRTYQTGKVYFQDDFGDGLEHWQRTYAGYSTVLWSANNSFSSGFSMLFPMGLTPGLAHRNDFNPVAKRGMEFSVGWGGAAGQLLAAHAFVANASIVYVASLGLSAGLSFIQTPQLNLILDPVPILRDVGPGTLYVAKFTADYAKHVWLTLTINGVNYDSQVANQSLLTQAVAYNSYPAYLTSLATGPGIPTLADLYVGHVILTEED
jgi:hypothetical protein